MPQGPQKLILIRAGRYDFAEIDLTGSVQIVGPNNTGKTTLINTLQFLYLDDRRHMDFGSYTPEQTRDYYFPGPYSYVLFQCLGSRGQCVLGWRGQARAAGGEPERFIYDGPFDPEDFLDEGHQVREPRAVAARLALRNFSLVRSAQEHRELLLMPTKGEARGLGLVALRDNDRYPHFRETLKNLLSLATITQDQMRDRLLMLAGLPVDKPALNIRDLLGDTYESILRRRDALVRFKEAREQVHQLVESHQRRGVLLRELSYRWADLRSKRDERVRLHEARVAAAASSSEAALRLVAGLGAEADDRRREERELSESRGSLLGEIRRIRDRRGRLADFVEELERAALENREKEIHALERQLSDASRASRAQAEQSLESHRQRALRLRASLEHLDRALVSVLRRDLEPAQLAGLASLFNADLLGLPVGDDGVRILEPKVLLQRLHEVASRIRGGAYRDGAVEIPLPDASGALAELADPEALRRRIAEEDERVAHWESMLAALVQHERLAARVQALRAEQEAARKRMFEWEELQQDLALLPRHEAELAGIDGSLGAVSDRIRDLVVRADGERRRHEEAERERVELRRAHEASMSRHALCLRPDTVPDPAVPSRPIPEEFDDAVAQYLHAQDESNRLGDAMARLRLAVESRLGSDHVGADDAETVRNLREELEALPEREDALRRDWETQVTEVRSKFDEVLRDLADIQGAAVRLNRALAGVQVSNLASLRLDVVEQPDVVGSLRKLAESDQPGLFDAQSGINAALASFKQRFEATPLLRHADLFTLRFTVTGDDGRPHHYNDFRQVESHGTTITIKVLFNLIVLRSLLREDATHSLLCEVPFFLDEIHSLDATNRHAILATARRLGFIALTAAPESVSEVSSLYFLQPHQGRIVLRQPHRIAVKPPGKGS